MKQVSRLLQAFPGLPSVYAVERCQLPVNLAKSKRVPAGWPSGIGGWGARVSTTVAQWQRRRGLGLGDAPLGR